MFFLDRFKSIRAVRRGLHIDAASRSAVTLRPGLHISKTSFFLHLVGSPAHITFLTANIAILIHMQLLSTRRKTEQEALGCKLDTYELMNFDDVVRSLDSQNKEIQNQIQELKGSKASEIKQKIAKPQPLRNLRPKEQPNTTRGGLFPAFLSTKQHRSAMVAQKQELLACKYARDRESYKKLIHMPALVDQLFPDFKCSAETDSCSEKNQLNPDSEQLEALTYTKTYLSPIQNSLMLISSSIVKQFLAELNVRLAFKDETLMDKYKDENYLTSNELLRNLSRKESSFIDELLAAFSENDSVSISEILPDLAYTETFNSARLKREDFYNYKSAHWLNYADSDTMNQIFSEVRPRFLSLVVNDEEYVSKFRSLFASYEADTHPFKHLNLALNVARVLAKGGKFSPSPSIFRILLEKFGETRLFNYQSLVYDGLPSFENGELRPLTERNDADINTQKLYLKLIEKDPEYLKGLMDYEYRKNKRANLRFLLGYFEVPTHSACENMTFLPLFLAKPMKSNYHSSTDPLSSHLSVGIETVESALSICARIGNYETMDRILVLLLSNLVRSADGVRVFLNELPKVYQNVTSWQDLFTETGLLTLGNAYLKDRDPARIQWLVPLVEEYLRDHSSESLVVLSTKLSKINLLGKCGMHLANESARSRESIRINPSKLVMPQKVPNLFIDHTAMA